jgi:SMP-30/Gluconolactonase/LRE-like region
VNRVACTVLITAVVTLVAAQEPSPAAIRAAYVDGLAAYKAKDYATYLSKMAEVSALRPTHPIFLNRLAGAYALNGKIAEAAATLQRLVALNLSHDVQADPDFAAVKDDPRIASVAAALRAVANERIGEAEIAFTIPDRTIIPEGIAYDETSRSFFVSSQYQRKIVRIDARGAVSDFITQRQDGIWMVFGIAVDAPRRRLWAVSTAEPEMSGFAPADKGRAGLFAFDLATGELLTKIVVNRGERANYFDDLTVARDGRVFVSSGAGSILTLAPHGEQLSVLVAPGTIQGPNGLALSPDNTRLYVSDYAGAIVLIDPRSGSTRRVTPPADATIYGIDGLTWADGSLIGVENGVEPARVVRLILSADGTRIDRVTILAMNHPKFAEPTIGVVAGQDYYFIANSHGGLMRRAKGPIADEPLTEPAVLRIRLK